MRAIRERNTKEVSFLSSSSSRVPRDVVSSHVSPFDSKREREREKEQWSSSSGDDDDHCL